jgi:hypothetical protein
LPKRHRSRFAYKGEFPRQLIPTVRRFFADRLISILLLLDARNFLPAGQQLRRVVAIPLRCQLAEAETGGLSLIGKPGEK